jgi:hypothetical protein
MLAPPVMLVLVASLVACGDPEAQRPTLPPNAQLVPSTPVAINVVAVSFSGMEQPARLVITDAATWATVWNTIHESIEPRPAPPTIDFGSSMIVVAAMGSRPTGGFAVSIEGVYRTDQKLYVVVKEISPGANCATTQAITAPVAAVSTGRLDLALTFIERRETSSCG